MASILKTWQCLILKPYQHTFHIISNSSLPSQALDGVINGQYVDTLPVLNGRARRDGHHIGQTYAQVVAYHAVHADLLIGTVIVWEHNADCLLATLALQENCVSAEKLQLLHFCLWTKMSVGWVFVRDWTFLNFSFVENVLS